MILEVDPASIAVQQTRALVFAPQWCGCALAVDAALAVRAAGATMSAGGQSLCSAREVTVLGDLGACRSQPVCAQCLVR